MNKLTSQPTRPQRLSKPMLAMAGGCIFCQIVDKKIPASIVFEDDKLIAFDDINPKAPVHILLVPKKHIATIDDIQESDKNLVGELVYRAKLLAREKRVSENGYRLVFNVRSHGGQIVDHIHLHLLGGQPLSHIC